MKGFESLLASPAKKAYLATHNRNVCDYSISIAAKMNLPEELHKVISKAALYHDIGKISIPDSILFKRGQLTGKEWEIMRLHPVFGVELLSSKCNQVVNAVRHHHERWDGTGYPDGMMAENIPLPARIIAAADAFDAMTMDRSYRKALPLEAAVQELREGAGTQFDPRVVEAFLSLNLPDFMEQLCLLN